MFIKEHIANLKGELNQMYKDKHVKDPAVNFAITQVENSIEYLETAFKQVINVDACEE